MVMELINGCEIICIGFWRSDEYVNYTCAVICAFYLAALII